MHDDCMRMEFMGRPRFETLMEDQLHYYFYFRLTSYKIGRSTRQPSRCWVNACLKFFAWLASSVMWSACSLPRASHSVHNYRVGRLYEGESLRHDTSLSKNFLPIRRFVDFISVLKSTCDECIESNLCSINLKMMWWRRSNANLLFERNFKKIAIAIARDLITSRPNILISMIMTSIPALAKGYVHHSSNHIHLISYPFFITLWYLSLLVRLIKVTASFQ